VPKKKIDDKFWERADSFIELANQHCGDIGRGKVSASLLYAAARFNAFVAASQSESGRDLRASKKEALDYFSDQFRKMLSENIDDYSANFRKYVKGKR
jgi:hypothetical protein